MRARVLVVVLVLMVAAGVQAGRVVLGRTADGYVLSTVALQSFPGGGVLDQRTGRLYVLDRPFGGFGYFYGGSSNYYYGAGSISSVSSYASRPAALTVVDTRGHSPVSTLSLGAAPRAVAVDAQTSTAYVATANADVRMVNSRSGAFQSRTAVGTSPRAVAVDEVTKRAFVVDDGDGTVRVLDAADGALLRTIHLSLGQSAPSVAVDEKLGRVYVAAGATLVALNARDGTPITTTSLQSDAAQQQFFAASRLAVDETSGRVYALDMGTLFSVDGSTGRIQQRIAVGQGMAGLAVDAARGHLLMVSGGVRGIAGAANQQSGKLLVMDARTGAVLRTLQVGLRPSAVFVDAQAGHAVVVDSGGRVPATNPWGWVPDGIRQHLPFSTGSPPARLVPGKILVLDLKQI